MILQILAVNKPLQVIKGDLKIFEPAKINFLLVIVRIDGIIRQFSLMSFW